MALNAITASRRIKAAREAVGITQEDVGARVASYGFGKHDVGKIERMDPTAPPLSQGRIDALAKITGFPVEWFTEPDLAKVFSPDQAPAEDSERRLAEVEEGLQRVVDAGADLQLAALREELLAELAVLRSEIDDLRKQQKPGGKTAGTEAQLAALLNEKRPPRRTALARDD